MTELLTSGEMRAIEHRAIDAGTASGLNLMERAGTGVVAAVLEEWPDLAAGSHRVAVLCGPGNNGGDGFVVARVLHRRGWSVDVFLLGDVNSLPGDARKNCERWLELGEIRPIADDTGDTADPEIIVDALFGTGLTRPLPEPVVAFLRRLHARCGAARFVGVDCASGICMDSGRALGSADANPFERDLIVQFHRAKIGQYLSPEADRTRALRIVDIGLDSDEGGAVRLARPIGATMKRGGGHKYAHGHALVVSGGMGRTGAARLAARGALRIGAGLVTVAAPSAAITECAAQLTAIMLRRCDDAAALEELLEDNRINALCLGPGLGTGEETRQLVCSALKARRACVLDADALSAFHGKPDDLFACTHANTVLTPHGGEFARLFPDLARRLEGPAFSGPAYSRVDAARDAARRAGSVILLKGADTVIADPAGCCVINSAHYGRSAPWLATAGAGDVLAGMICGLMARGLTAMDAAENGAWLHVEAARRFGPGLIAEDLPETLPDVFRSLDD